MLKNLTIICVTCSLLSLGASSCGSAPKIEICLHNDDGSAECNDPRLPDEEQDYHRPASELENFVSTNPDDFVTLLEACRRWKDD